MKYAVGTVAKVFEHLVRTDSRVATKFLSPRFVIRMTRRTCRGKFIGPNLSVELTIGRPNFVERKFIKSCEKAGERFPVKKIQLKPLRKQKCR